MKALGKKKLVVDIHLKVGTEIYTVALCNMQGKEEEEKKRGYIAVLFASLNPKFQGVGTVRLSLSGLALG